MNANTIANAVEEAKRFLLRYAEWQAKQGQTYEYAGHTHKIDTPRENGALRRASLDLTVALAEMRKYT